MTGGTNAVIPLYKETASIGKQQVDAGTVRVKKVVKTETVNQPVELRHEEIVIERQPASESSGTASANAFQEQETVIHLTKEEPVIQKQTVSSGQVVLRGSTSSEQRNIQTQVRSEDVAVAKSGDAENVTIGQGVQQSSEAAGAAESPSGQMTGQTTGQITGGAVITDPMMLSSSSASSLSGNAAQFQSLKVQDVTGDHVAKCAAAGGQAVYLFSDTSIANLKKGAMIDVTGTLKTGSAGLSGKAGETLSSQPAYVETQSIVSSSSY